MNNTNTAALLMNVGKLIKSTMGPDLPLSFTQCEVLRLLEHEKALTMRAIAAHFAITAPSATSLIKHLASDGLVSRAANTRDRREVLLHITDRGKQKLRRVEHLRKKSIAQVLSVLNERDREQLDIILTKIINTTRTQ